MSEFKALGNKVTKFQGFETFEKPKNILIVTLESDEVTALCPITEQPDWYTVRVTYSAIDKCLESKSFKLYVQSFRDKGMFVEALASQMADDIFAALSPKSVSVDIIQKPRGGVTIIASARCKQEEESK